MSITVHESGAVSYVGPDATRLVRLRMLVTGLRLEVSTGMRLTRGRSCYAIAKSEFGLRGSKARVLEQMESILAAAIASYQQQQQQDKAAV